MPTKDADRLHKCLQTSQIVIGARVKSNADPVADSFHRVRGQVILSWGLCSACCTCTWSNVYCAVQFGHFDFDFVHDQNCGQEDVFYTTVRPLVHKLVEVCMLLCVSLCVLCCCKYILLLCPHFSAPPIPAMVQHALCCGSG